MRLSLNWLADYVSLDATPSQIANALDEAGFEVEAIRRLDEGIEGVVVGRVESVDAHPDADKLRICTVRYGAPDVATVICGAANFAAGARVAFAPVGAELPGGFRIARRKIRGVESEGMICSEEELGLADASEGILVLPEKENPPPSGMPITLALGLDETIIDFDITPNRPDAMSVIGLAREAAAAFGAELSLPEVRVVEAGGPIEDLIRVENLAPSRCPRYSARVIDGVKIGPAPEWMANRLTAAGLRPVNNVVDVTNYVLIECGHPLHAFDHRKIGDGVIRVRLAEGGEAITTLDGVTRALAAEDLVIADAEKPMALAGIMGGEGSEIGDDTSTIVLESAYFEPSGILASSKRLGLRSESSARFERGADPAGVLWAADRATAMIAELGGGTVAGGVIDDYPAPIERAQILLRTERTNQILGTDVPIGEQSRLLRSIAIDVEHTDDTGLEILAPSFRPDLTREIDLIEEIGRLHGYSNIRATLPRSEGRIGGLSDRQQMRRLESEVLRGAGLTEIQSFSFVGPEDLLNGESRVALVSNPLRSEESILRPSLLPGLIRAVAFNLSHRRSTVCLFEIGRVFGPTGDAGMPAESERVSAIIAGEPANRAWPDSLGYLALKGVIETFLARLDIKHGRFDPAERQGLHPGRTATLTVGETPVGVIGELHPSLVESKGLGESASVFELDQNALLDQIPTTKRFRAFSRYPLASVDLAFVVDEDVAAAEVEAAVRDACGEALESIHLFDVYRGEQVSQGRKSLAFALGLASDDHTLSDEEVAALRERAIAGARHECGAELRGA